MSNIKVFNTKAETEEHIKTMRGWTAKAVRYADGEDDDLRYCIECNGNKYLHDTGFVHSI